MKFVRTREGDWIAVDHIAMFGKPNEEGYYLYMLTSGVSGYLEPEAARTLMELS